MRKKLTPEYPPEAQNPRNLSHSAFDSSEINPELLRALCRGEHGAFREIYLSYVTPVKEFLKLLTRSEEDAEEITQDVFITIWEKHHQINPDKSFKGYLYTIARNAALRLFERKKVHEKYVHSPISRPLDSSPSDEYLIAEETELLIEIAVSRMPAQRRKIFEMNRNEGLKSNEIAEKLNLSKYTVDNHLYAARKDIRQIIAMFMLFFMSQ